MIAFIPMARPTGRCLGSKSKWLQPAEFPRIAFIRLARSKKLHYAGPVAGGVFPPHPLSVVPLAIQISCEGSKTDDVQVRMAATVRGGSAELPLGCVRGH